MKLFKLSATLGVIALTAAMCVPAAFAQDQGKGDQPPQASPCSHSQNEGNGGGDNGSPNCGKPRVPKKAMKLVRKSALKALRVKIGVDGDVGDLFCHPAGPGRFKCRASGTMPAPTDVSASMFGPDDQADCGTDTGELQWDALVIVKASIDDEDNWSLKAKVAKFYTHDPSGGDGTNDAMQSPFSGGDQPPVAC